MSDLNIFVVDDDQGAVADFSLYEALDRELTEWIAGMTPDERDFYDALCGIMFGQCEAVDDEVIG